MIYPDVYTRCTYNIFGLKEGLRQATLGSRKLVVCRLLLAPCICWFHVSNLVVLNILGVCCLLVGCPFPRLKSRLHKPCQLLTGSKNSSLENTRESVTQAMLSYQACVGLAAPTGVWALLLLVYGPFFLSTCLCWTNVNLVFNDNL